MMRTLIFGLTFLVAFGANICEVASEQHPQLIVVSVPGGDHASYYKNELGGSLQPIIDMFGEYSKQVEQGGDEFLVLYGENELDLILDSPDDKFSTETRFLQVDKPVDIWMRDFSPALTYEQVKFMYLPDYLTVDEAEGNENDFKYLIQTELGKQFDSTSNIKLDGGNVVENDWDKAIITDRILYDNWPESGDSLKQKLESLLDRKVAFITDPGDYTGHADGLVAFIDSKKLLMGYYGNEEKYQNDTKRIKEAFGENAVDIVRLPSYVDTADSDNRSAKGAYINMLVSDLAIYMPVFGNPSADQAAYDVVSTHAQNSGKTVYKVDTSKLAHMGGNVRCMSWQLYKNNHIAQALLGDSQTIDQLSQKRSLKRLLKMIRSYHN